MSSLLYLPVLPPEHRKPHALRFGTYYNPEGRRLRYAHLPVAMPRARVIYCGGLSQPIESDYENLRDLAAMDLEVYCLERFGEGGSARMYPHDLQKPAALPIRYFAHELLDFTRTLLPADGLPRYYLGSCYGGLVGLESCRLDSDCFTALLLAAPMFGNNFMQKNGGETFFANLMLAPDEETKYWGKAQDWSEALAVRALERDDTTHDPLRGALRFWWFREQPGLQLGGYTLGRLRQTASGLLDLMAPGVLEQITSRILIVSGTEDTHNLQERHIEFARRLPNSSLHKVTGARHGLWRESDPYRNQLLALVADLVTL
jgi:lysophospholipase